MTGSSVEAETYAAVIEMATEPLYAVGSDGRFETVNGEFQRVTGYDRETLLGMGPERLLCEDDSDEWKRRVQLLRSGDSRQTEQWVGHIESNTGAEIPLEWVITLRTVDGETCVVGRAEDLREEDRQKQKLNVLNRTLRHNIRNQMNIIVGKATALQNVDDEGYRTAAEKIESIGQEIINISNKARKAQEHVDIPPDDECERDLVEAVETAVSKFEITHPKATVETSVPEKALARAPPGVDAAIVELLENATVHHPSGSGPVYVDVKTTDEQVAVHVTDECEPVPAQVREALGRGVEQPLHHSDGLGLWIAQWAVESVNGTLSFDRRDDEEGNVVTLTFDRVTG